VWLLKKGENVSFRNCGLKELIRSVNQKQCDTDRWNKSLVGRLATKQFLGGISAEGFVLE